MRLPQGNCSAKCLSHLAKGFDVTLSERSNGLAIHALSDVQSIAHQELAQLNSIRTKD
jgi:hypothetical protein